MAKVRFGNEIKNNGQEIEKRIEKGKGSVLQFFDLCMLLLFPSLCATSFSLTVPVLHAVILTFFFLFRSLPPFYVYYLNNDALISSKYLASNGGMIRGLWDDARSMIGLLIDDRMIMISG